MMRRPLLIGVLLAMLSGSGFAQDSRLISGNGRVVLSVQDDGNVVIYIDAQPVWASGTQIPPPPLPPPTPPPPTVGWQFVDQGGVLTAGQPGSPSDRLSGAISPTRVWQADDVLFMEFVGADGDREDGGPAHRRLLRARSLDGGASWSTQHTAPLVVQEWSPRGDPEEGVFSATRLYFSAVTATDSAGSVNSDVRLRADGRVILAHDDPTVWGWGDEIFIIAQLTDGSLIYVAKGHGVFWGLGIRHPDGTTEQAITGMVVGGSCADGFCVLVRDFNAGGSRIEWYRETDFSRPIHVSTFGARHITPFYDGAAWVLYGRTPGDSDEIRRWRLEEPSPPSSNPADELDLPRVIWLHEDISGWDQTSTVIDTRVWDNGVCINHTMAGQWPVFVDGGTRGEGNPWVFANIGGQWYGATFEWLRPGQQCKGVTRLNIGPHTKRSPLSEWAPRSGETVGFAMSTPARSNLRTSNERSNIVLVVWP